jgi:hypothetical protein
MNILEFADVIDEDIIIRRYSNQNNRWMCEFESHCVVKDGDCVIGMYGDGRTPQEAIDNYVEKIQGRTLIFDGYGGDKAREYVFPKYCASANLIQPVGGITR